ncbi:MAG TPA: hypothetical protein VIL52_00730 [Bacteroidota bacterium]
MTKLLEKAVETVNKLPEKEQDAVATIILEEIAVEERWSKIFSESQEKLSFLAKEALEEYKRGDTKPLNF